MTDLLYALAKYRDFVRTLAGWFVPDDAVQELLDSIEDGAVSMDAVYAMLTKPQAQSRFRMSESMMRLPSVGSCGDP